MSQPVFLSSVTSDFPNYRQWIAEDLRKSDAEVRDQEHFRNRGSITAERVRRAFAIAYR